jgi:hypothetical protein
MRESEKAGGGKRGCKTNEVWNGRVLLSSFGGSVNLPFHVGRKDKRILNWTG